jgi:energy-coupling factor transporter ATP-binding protein EcfA2
MADIRIRSNDRVLIAGKTGSGKTYLARFLTRKLPRLIVIDSKASLGEWNLDPWNGDARRRLKNNEPVRARVLDDLQREPEEQYAELATLLLQSGNVTLYIDELYAVVPPSSRIPPPINALWTRGREPGIGVWASTQRPVWIPLVALSEAEHLFCFRLSLLDDRRRMAEFMTEEVLSRISDVHGFYYMQASEDEPHFIPELKTGKEPTIEATRSRARPTGLKE